MFAKLSQFIDGRYREETDDRLNIVYSFFRIFLSIGILYEVGWRYTFYALGFERGWIGVLLSLSVFLFFLGVQARMMALISAILFFNVLKWGYVEHIRAYKHAHPLLIGIMLLAMAFTKSDRHLSLARWHRPIDFNLNLPVLTIFRMQAIVIYVCAMHSKLNPAFLSGYGLEQIFIREVTGSLNPWLIRLEWMFQPLSILVVAAEISLPVLLLYPSPKIRKFGIVAGWLFHTGLYFLIPVGSLSFLMCLLLFAFLEPLEFANDLRVLSST